MTFARQVLGDPPQWDRSEARFTKLHIDSKGTIENDGHGMLQVGAVNGLPWEVGDA